MASPLLRRLRFSPRWAVTVKLVAWFALLALVLAPAGSRIEGARVARVGTVVTAGSLVVDVVARDPLEVTIRPS